MDGWEGRWGYSVVRGNEVRGRLSLFQGDGKSDLATEKTNIHSVKQHPSNNITTDTFFGSVKFF